jgi:hypothetical protein
MTRFNKFLFASAIFLVVNAVSALSLNIPKSLIDLGMAKKFPKEKLTITLDQPVTKFSKERQKIELCGTWASKIPQRSGDFCVDTQPVWNKEKGDIEISKVNILKLVTADGKELSGAISGTLNSTVLTLLDGTSVYHVPDMIGKRLDAIEIQDNSFKLIF